MYGLSHLLRNLPKHWQLLQRWVSVRINLISDDFAHVISENSVIRLFFPHRTYLCWLHISASCQTHCSTEISLNCFVLYVKFWELSISLCRDFEKEIAKYTALRYVFSVIGSPYTTGNDQPFEPSSIAELIDIWADWSNRDRNVASGFWPRLKLTSVRIFQSGTSMETQLKYARKTL